MKLLGQMKGFKLLPFDDGYAAAPFGTVAMGDFLVTIVGCYRDIDDQGHDVWGRLVVRSFPPSLQTRETGRVEAWSCYLDEGEVPPPEGLPWPSLGYIYVNFVKLDESRLLVLWQHRTAQYEDTRADSPTYVAAYVVSISTTGALSRGPFVSFMDETIMVGGVTYKQRSYGMRSVLVAPNAIDVYTDVEWNDNGTFRNAVLKASTTVSGTTVAPASGYELAAQDMSIGLGGGAFALNGQSYFLASAGDGQGQDEGPSTLYGNGRTWPVAQYVFMARANHLAKDAWLLTGAGTFRFDGETLTRDRDYPVAGVTAADTVKWLGGQDWWTLVSESDLVTPTKTFLVWDWDRVFGEVSASGTGLKQIDLHPLLADLNSSGDYQGMTATVTGRNAVVQVHCILDRGDGNGQLASRDFLVELVAPPRLGPGVRGAHFTRGA